MSKFVIHKYIRGRFDTFEETFNYHSTIPIVFDSQKDARDWLRVKGCSFEKDLIKIIETLGRKVASTSLSNLKIAEVKDKWRIVEYDGWETVETPESIKWND